MQPLWRILVLTAMLVVMPAVSWYYLSKGMSYRKESLQQLADLGPAPAINETDVTTGKVFSPDSFQNRICIIAFPAYDEPKQRLALEKLHGQFSEREDIKMVLFFPSPQPNERWMPYLPQHLNLLQFRSGSYEKLKSDYKGPAEARFVTYVDYKNKIRKHYDTHLTKDMQALVEHITMLLPVVQKEKATIVRDNL